MTRPNGSDPTADRVLGGWGRATASRATVTATPAPQALAELLASRPARGVLARGSGCSYGDAAQNAGGVVLLPEQEPCIEVDAAHGTVRASAGTTFRQLLHATVPLGLLPPVLPGTGRLTLGGAVAADVHGKNHRRDGSLGRWLDKVQLLCPDGSFHDTGPTREADLFRATVGGMGLTGIILQVELRLLRVAGAHLRVSSRRAGSLDEVLELLDTAPGRYAVAWIDATSTGRALGRGIVESADHLDRPDPHLEPQGPNYPCPADARLTLPPVRLVTPRTAQAFNSAWFHRAPRHRDSTRDLTAFFHRLDALPYWNRLAGPRGLVQYQFVVPDPAQQVLATVLAILQRSAAAPYLGTLKRFGPAGSGPLSFPLPGWALAVDLPVGTPRLADTLDRLDRTVAEAGGRVYLAKDSRMTRDAFRAMYGPLDDWHAVRAAVDPHATMRSDLGRRLGLC